MKMPLHVFVESTFDEAHPICPAGERKGEHSGAHEPRNFRPPLESEHRNGDQLTR